MDERDSFPTLRSFDLQNVHIVDGEGCQTAEGTRQRAEVAESRRRACIHGLPHYHLH